jgi:hypothetical protein
VILRAEGWFASVGETRGRTVPLHLSLFSYAPETWARLIGNPDDRHNAARSYIESVVGQLHGSIFGLAAGAVECAANRPPGRRESTQ